MRSCNPKYFEAYRFSDTPEGAAAEKPSIFSFPPNLGQPLKVFYQVKGLIHAKDSDWWPYQTSRSNS